MRTLMAVVLLASTLQVAPANAQGCKELHNTFGVQVRCVNKVLKARPFEPMKKPPSRNTKPPKSDSPKQTTNNLSEIWACLYMPFDNSDTCEVIPPKGPGPNAPEPKPVNIHLVSQEAALKMKIPAPKIVLGPDPSVNKWNMTAVGFPNWLWTEEASSLNSVVTEQGITITMTATRASSTVAWGDGTTSTCTSMTPRPEKAGPRDKSPDCGHVYLKAQDPTTISVTANWTITWRAMGQSGTVRVSRDASRTVKVGELNAVLTDN